MTSPSPGDAGSLTIFRQIPPRRAKMSQMNDVVRRVLEGDRDAYREIVKEYGASIGGFIAAYLPQRELVDDLAQETFVAAYQHLNQFKTDQELGPWLKGIARNKVITHLRQRYRHGAAIDRLKAEALEKVAGELDRAQSSDDSGSVDRLRHCLESHGIHARFMSLQTADRHPSKPHPAMALAAIAETGAAPETSVVIGDTSYDIGMALTAGAGAIGVAGNPPVHVSHRFQVIATIHVRITSLPLRRRPAWRPVASYGLLGRRIIVETTAPRHPEPRQEAGDSC